MKSIANYKLLNSRARFSQVATLGGMLLALAGVLLPNWVPSMTNITPPLIFGGLVIGNIGIYFANRWAKRPRPEDRIDDGLKRLNNQSKCYHYLLPEKHVLVTPSGVIVLEVCALEGKFVFHGGKWQRKFSLTRLLRFFVEEQFGDPIKRVQAGAEKIRALIATEIDEPVPIDAIVVFTDPNAELDVEDPPVPVVQPDNLRALLPKHEKLSQEMSDRLLAFFDEAAGLVDDDEDEGEEED